jgi:putative Mg2+ transporter-C (MgtC) family protein
MPTITDDVARLGDIAVMHSTLDWYEIAIRLLLTLLAGGLVGLNRTEHGRPAGLRTTMLVCLAASISMIQANLLMNTNGKPSDSFITLDLMRLPLGILTGVGFIGAGAILRKDDIVFGITTAATLWFVTVLGLCFGGGQLALGLIGLAVGLVVLWGLKWAEQHIRADHRATLAVTTTTNGLTEQQLGSELDRHGFHVRHWNSIHTVSRQSRKLECDVGWRRRPVDDAPPVFLNELSARADVQELEWKEAFRD